MLVEESRSSATARSWRSIGPNGVGKTTLAKLAVRLLTPGAGRVISFGRATYLPQDPGRYLIAETVLAEVALAAGETRARQALESSLGLSTFAHRHPRDLSSGERERLGIACVLAVEPGICWALDEPTRGVDPERKRDLAALLRAQAPQRATLVVTHDRAFAEAVVDRYRRAEP